EGSGTLDALQAALRDLTGLAEVDRAAEAEVYAAMLRERYVDPGRIVAAAGTWDSDARVAVGS
ncbi:MAG: hypothetical protein RI554_09885, partial [Trueperaceae bacterium]|nr:hypothetical protein [Trueperaceae bacterium]